MRLMKILESLQAPDTFRVLDLGCAGGRNTLPLAQRGVDFHAVDTSRAMVEHTRQRVEAVAGPREAAARVHRGSMDNLAGFEDGAFDLVVALGVYHNASSADEFDRAIGETSRVTKVGGQALVASFEKRTDPTGAGITPVSGLPNVYEGFRSGRVYLVSRTELDEAFAHHSFRPVVPSETVRVDTERGRRVTVNALYQRQ
jgi:SAM-dependent methyltransferase